VGDFNEDGIVDLAVIFTGNNNVTISLNNGDGTFTTLASGPATGNTPSGITVGDFNGDGKLDLAVTNGHDNTVSILLGNQAISHLPVFRTTGDHMLLCFERVEG
jgi:hypothetical protein